MKIRDFFSKYLIGLYFIIFFIWAFHVFHDASEEKLINDLDRLYNTKQINLYTIYSKYDDSHLFVTRYR